MTVGGEQDRESEPGKKKESKTAWKETRRGGKISTRSESKRLEIRVHGKEK